MKLYSDLAPHYFNIEKFGRKFDEEIQFLVDIFKRHKIQSILDLGCGSGEHIQELQAKGFQIMGIDSSPKMIEIALERFPQCKFELGDIVSYQAKESFDGIICLFGTFNYLLSTDEITESLKNIHKNLKSAGIVVFEIWNAEPIQRIKRKPLTKVSTVNSHGKTIRRNRGFRLTPEASTVVVEVNYIYNLDNGDIKDRHLMRVFHLNEIQELIQNARFEVLNVYGNYLQGKFHKTSARILIVAKKR